LNKNSQISKNFKWSEFLVSEDFPEIILKYDLFNLQVGSRASKMWFISNECLNSGFVESSTQANKCVYQYMEWLRTKIWFFTHNTLQRLRNIIDKPMVITSGWRPQELNNCIPGASQTSDHLYRGMSVAVDFKVLGFGKVEATSFYRSAIPYILDQNIIPFGQCIIYDSFIHISSNTEKHQYEIIYK